MRKLFTVEHVLGDIDMDAYKHTYTEIKNLSNIAKPLVCPHERGLLRNKINHLRSEFNSMATSYFRVNTCFDGKGRARHSEEIYHYPGKEDLEYTVRVGKQKIARQRKANKFVASLSKEFNGLKYNVIGGVFTKDKSILTQIQANPSERIENSKRPHEKILDKYLGIELEFLTPVTLDTLKTCMIAAHLEGYVHVGTDGSVQSESGFRGAEIRVLCKERDAVDIVTRVCKVLNIAGCKVNNSCGMHVHFDMRARSEKKCYTNLVRLLPLLKSMVPSTRTGEWGERYCRTNKYADMDEQLSSGSRYYAINAEAYREHTTLEVRLHSGTLNANKILNWIAIIVNVLECPSIIKKDISNLEDYKQYFEVSAKLAEYITKRVALFSSVVDTTTDELIHINYELCA